MIDGLRTASGMKKIGPVGCAQAQASPAFQ